MALVVVAVGAVGACGGTTDPMAAAPDAGVPATDAGPDAHPDADPDRTCASGVAEFGVCPPEPPRQSEALDCPSGALDDHGICPPTPPAPPLFASWPCAEGWRPRAAVDEFPTGVAPFTVCEPAPTQLDCAPGLLPLVGRGCVPLGPECPDGDWPDETLLRARAPSHDGRIVYVRPDGVGAGSRDAPFGTVSAAVQAATDGDIVALAPGDYSDNIEIHTRVAIVGSCAEGSRLRAPADSDTTATIVVTSTLTVADLTVIGPAPGISVARAGALDARGIAIAGARRVGIETFGAPVSLDHTLIEGTLTSLADGTGGHGLDVWQGGRATVTAAAILSNHEVGVFADGRGSQIELADAIIADTDGRDAGILGYGLHTQAGASATASRIWLRGNQGIGVAAFGRGSSLVLTDATVAGTRYQPADGRHGRGLQAQEGASVQLTRVVFSGNHDVGVSFAGSDVDATDLVVEGTAPPLRAGQGRGISAAMGGTVALRRTVVAGNREAGLLADAGTRMTAADLLIVDTLTTAQGAPGRGLFVQDGAEVLLERAVIARSQGLGCAATLGASLEASDLSVDATAPDGAGEQGYGVFAVAAGTIDVHRLAVTASHRTGVYCADPGSRIDIADGVVANTHPQRSDGLGGRGVDVSTGAALRATRLRVSRNVGVGIFAGGPQGTTLALEDVTILDTQTTDAEPGGRGLSVTAGTNCSVERAAIVGNRDIGVAVRGPDATVHMVDVSVRGTLPRADGRFGLGLALLDAADLRGERIELTQNHCFGLFAVGSETRAEVDDISIVDTQPQRSDARFGYGLYVVNAAAVDLTRTRLVRSHQVAALVGLGGAATLDDLSIEDTLEAACGAACADDSGGSGLVVVHGGTIDVAHFLIRRSDLAGFQMAGDVDVEARDGLITDNVIGVALSAPDVDLATSFERVRTFGNVRDRDFSDVPAPDPEDGLASLGPVLDE